MNEENKEILENIDQYFRAANYLSACQLYLRDNPLLKRPLKMSDIKKKLVGHWGTVPGQNFIYAHLNRVIKKYDLDMIYVCGPGHGGNAPVANCYLEGTYSEVYPNITQDEEGLKKFFKQFSFPGGIPSHDAPETPGSINEGGELGYSLAHAYGAILDNKDLIAACVIGDGEAETGPLAASWQINKIINPKTDGAVLPILHLNGYKIANPTVLARISKSELTSYLTGCGYKPYFVEGSASEFMHKAMASTMDKVINDIKDIWHRSREENDETRPVWPLIVLITKKGWTGPKEVEGSFRAHQVPLEITDEEHLQELEDWLRSYRPEELFTKNGQINENILSTIPKKDRRMSANPHANGGKLLKEMTFPNFKDYAVDVLKPGEKTAQDMKILGNYVRDLIKLNEDKRNFRVFAPDETLSNRLNSIFEVTNRQWDANKLDSDEYLNNDGRVIDSILSEHICQGLLEGYILTGRHGFFNCYEAFIRIIDSMVSQHAKWLKICNELPWRADIASLNYVLSSHVWQQDHNGYTHQDPGFLNHLVTKKASIVRMYLPPDANCLLSCFDHCMHTKNYINVIVASKHPSYQWLSMEQAVKHCTQGIGIWTWASNDSFEEPDIIMACAGDTPTLEALAATKILRSFFKELKIRFVNVVDLMKLQSNKQHPHGISDTEYDLIFTKDKPIIFAFHGYPDLIHQLTYNRTNTNLHVRGYIEEGTITTPFDMRVKNKIDRFNLVLLALKHLDKLGDKRSEVIQYCKDKLIEHNEYIVENGIDMEEIINWKWED